MQEEHTSYAVSTLIAKKLAGEITADEESELDRWKSESPENTELFNAVVDPKNKAERDAFLKDIDVRADWQKVSERLFVKNAPRHLHISLYRVAAAVALLCMATAVFFLARDRSETVISLEERAAMITSGTSQATVKLHNGQTIMLSDITNQHKEFEEANGTNLYNTPGSLAYSTGEAGSDELIYNEIHIPRGGEYQLILSDGTRVWLNAETQLRYPVKFSAEERVVELTGEAYFEVTHQPGRPFIVSTLRNGEVQVYGTRFNINAYADNDQVWVTLNEGKVSVKKETGDEVMLEPDEQAILDGTDDSIAVVKVDASQFSAWKEGVLTFDNMSLEEIGKLLSRWYDVEFEFENDRIRQYRFTANIKRYGTFRDVLRFFEKTDQLTFEIDGNRIRVNEKKAVNLLTVYARLVPLSRSLVPPLKPRSVSLLERKAL